MKDYKQEYMLAALNMAKEAYDDGEVPIGAVIVRNGEIVAAGRNRREKQKNALLHAEIDAEQLSMHTFQRYISEHTTTKTVHAELLPICLR